MLPFERPPQPDPWSIPWLFDAPSTHEVPHIVDLAWALACGYVVTIGGIWVFRSLF